MVHPCRAFGGQGDLDGAIILVVWLQFVLFVLQLVQTLFLTAIPFIAQLIGFVAFFLTFYLACNFIAVLHGFRSQLNVFVGMLATLFAFALVVTVVLGILGIEINPVW